ncbi:HD-GYP domain-containing protein [Desulfoluna butyratoxydans]|uniref:Signal transduction response regulator receiver domain n=1 Tax=Desulfoluna butyratoxydans TaxID=231438 RepID=A0A4V6ILD5_9BACT|nr:HD domain-containing phosphohydrolase [Desulfoluna butyratoxydans]VFQ44708.1 signal transduction response regulator receiver domain [Desulfoluna butyratoxydans]
MTKQKTKNPPGLLIVDDDETIRMILRRVMEKQGFVCHMASHGVEALAVLEKHPVEIVLTDVDMPEMGGLELVKQIRARHTADPIVMTGHIDDFSYEQIIQTGAVDFILKPMAPGEVVLRVQRVLRERRLVQGLKETHQALKDSYLDTINRLVTAAEYRDENTGSHITRMSTYSAFLAEKMNMDGAWVDRIRYGSVMHDIGKIGIPDHILMKPDRLSGDEFHVIRTHPAIGARILANAKSDVLRSGQQIAISHHEKWDGTGYPQGLSGDRIPLAGRIVGIADVFDALSTRRPYKDPYPPDVIYGLMQEEREKHFDPDLTDIVLDNFDEFLAIRNGNCNGSAEMVNSGAAFSWSRRDAGMEKPKGGAASS